MQCTTACHLTATPIARTEVSQTDHLPLNHREMLTDLGPSFIKAGQVLASRPDIVREDYMNELCTLQDDVPSFSDQLVGPERMSLSVVAND